MRPCQLLSKEELNKYQSNGVLSELYWWYSDDDRSVESFKEVVRITEPQFINNFELRERIVANESAKYDYELTVKIRKLVKNGVPDFKTQFVPEKEKDGIPLIWFTAAEYIEKDEKDFCKNAVFMLAADAYRQYRLDELSDLI